MPLQLALRTRRASPPAKRRNDGTLWRAVGIKDDSVEVCDAAVHGGDGNGGPGDAGSDPARSRRANPAGFRARRPADPRPALLRLSRPGKAQGGSAPRPEAKPAQ